MKLSCKKARNGFILDQNSSATSITSSPVTPSPKLKSSREDPWYEKKPMLKFLITLLFQPEKYSTYITWVTPPPSTLTNEYFDHPNFGVFSIVDKHSLSRLWAAVREKRIVSSVKDGFLRNLRLYYDKRDRSGNVVTGIIKPIKHIVANLSPNVVGRALTRVQDTWQFVDKETIIFLFKNINDLKGFTDKQYPEIPKESIEPKRKLDDVPIFKSAVGILNSESTEYRTVIIRRFLKIFNLSLSRNLHENINFLALKTVRSSCHKI